MVTPATDPRVKELLAAVDKLLVNHEHPLERDCDCGIELRRAYDRALATAEEEPKVERVEFRLRMVTGGHETWEADGVRLEAYYSNLSGALHFYAERLVAPPKPKEPSNEELADAILAARRHGLKMTKEYAELAAARLRSLPKEG